MLSASDIKICEHVMKELVNYSADDGYGIMDITVPSMQQNRTEESNSVNPRRKRRNQKSGLALLKCQQQYTKKYTSRARKSPPFPSQECPGKFIIGNDKETWQSRENIRGRGFIIHIVFHVRGREKKIFYTFIHN